MRARRLIEALGVAAAAVTLSIGAARAADFGDADPLLGTNPHRGELVPGPQVPFGFANPSPDTTAAGTSGYNPAGLIRGFSQTHVSGTGGAGRYGNFRVTPLLDGAVAAIRLAPERIGWEQAQPGYYSTVLEPSGIGAELTATRRVAVHRYTFPRHRRAGLFLDVGSVVPIGRGEQVPSHEWVKLGAAGEVEGGATFLRGWGVGSYTLYFAATLDRRATWRIARNRRALAQRAAREGNLGVLASFTSGARPQATLRVGLSFLSAGQALRNARREARGLGFEGVRDAAAALWREALAKISVAGGSADDRTKFASALYHSQLMPHELSGENVWWSSKRPHYEDFYTLWDTFRTLHPLLGLIQPQREGQMIASLLDTYKHTGWLPDGRVAGNNGLTQGGSDADIVIADAIVKHVTGFDYATAYRALLKDATVNSQRFYAEGRQLDEYVRRGYVTTDERASATRTLEYAYDDFAISEVAGALGHPRVAKRLRARSRTWSRLWDARRQVIHPRLPSGAFAPAFSPARTYLGWKDPFYEGNAYQYSTFVPHDVQGLINRLGGDAGAVAWLDRFFGGRTSGYTPSNEHDLLAPYLYIHAGRPDLTDALVRILLKYGYRTGRDGFPGDDDSGAMSSWYVWGAIGLYPNAGQPYYYIGSPVFTRAQLDLGNGRQFTVSAPAASDLNRYVVAATLNGKPVCRAYLTSDEVAAGGELVLTMAAAPAGWGTCSRPPSVESPR